MTGPRVLIAGNFHWQAGFSHTVAGYVDAARAVGCEVRVSGPLSRMDSEVPRHLPVEHDPGWGTHLVMMFEARQFLSPEQLELACAFPRSRRLIVDFDLHWGEEDPAMAGHGMESKYTAESWRTLYTTLSDLVLQPRMTETMPPGAEFFACFGMPETVSHPLARGRDRDYELQYIGSNWGRWKPLTTVVDAAATLRPAPRMRVCGRWWDGTTTCPGFEDVTTAVPGWLPERGVEVCPPVPFGEITAEMGRALISPVLVSPLVASTGLLTARVFETLASGSLPVIPADAEFLAAVYGDDAKHLMLGTDPAEVLARLTTEFEEHARIVGAIQERLRTEYGYRRVLKDLLAFFG
ncbi:MAG: glycosyltransferase [Actinophytocola sp.]|uniref:glycosyltransferase family protein n=1 Tax=Actinophytocola sp. TaxID=1872138 RepID=UPI003C740EBF